MTPPPRSLLLLPGRRICVSFLRTAIPISSYGARFPNDQPQTLRELARAWVGWSLSSVLPVEDGWGPRRPSGNLAVWRVAGRRFGAPRRANSPTQDWGRAKSSEPWSMKRWPVAAGVAGSFCRRGAPAQAWSRGEELQPPGGCVGASARPGVCLETRPAVLGLSNRRNCSEIPSAALASRPIIRAWRVCKC